MVTSFLSFLIKSISQSAGLISNQKNSNYFQFYFVFVFVFKFSKKLNRWIFMRMKWIAVCAIIHFSSVINSYSSKYKGELSLDLHCGCTDFRRFFLLMLLYFGSKFTKWQLWNAEGRVVGLLEFRFQRKKKKDFSTNLIDYFENLLSYIILKWIKELGKKLTSHIECMAQSKNPLYISWKCWYIFVVAFVCRSVYFWYKSVNMHGFFPHSVGFF